MAERRFSKVAVLMGGISSERKISLKTGAAVVEGLKEGGYDVVAVDIEHQDFQIPKGVEAAFVALHGKFGEDGGVQEKLQDMNIPFTGSGPESSRISFDKILTRDVLTDNSIPVARGEVLHRPDQRTLDFPLVVKPPREGSSVGCNLVHGPDGWEDAFRDTAQYSKDVLVEEFILGRELTVGVVNGKALPVVEIIPETEWFDFEAKYESEETGYICPAELDEVLAEALQEIALDTYRVLKAEGLGRVDFRLSPKNEPFVLELNSIPGFTASSLLPKAAKAVGIGFSELCCGIMETAHL